MSFGRWIQAVATFCTILGGVALFVGPAKATPWPIVGALLAAVAVTFVATSSWAVRRMFVKMPEKDLARALERESGTFAEEFWAKTARALDEASAIADVADQVAARLRDRCLRREVEFSNDFRDYCVRCTDLVRTSTGRIYTVQTPYEVEGEDKTAFHDYVRSTVEKLQQPLFDRSP